MVARAGEAIVFPQDVSQGYRTRATMKAINAAPRRPSSALAPTEEPTLFREGDAYEGRSIGHVRDKSAPTG